MPIPPESAQRQRDEMERGNPLLSFEWPPIPDDLQWSDLETKLGRTVKMDGGTWGSHGYGKARTKREHGRYLTLDAIRPQMHAREVAEWSREEAVSLDLTRQYPGLKWLVQHGPRGIMATPYDNGAHGAQPVRIGEINLPVHDPDFHALAADRAAQAAEAPERCQHDWGTGTPVGKCLTDYTCRKCGKTRTLDSSD